MSGNFLVVQWLGLGVLTAWLKVQSLFRELSSCNRCSKKKKKGGGLNGTVIVCIGVPALNRFSTRLLSLLVLERLPQLACFSV